MHPFVPFFPCTSGDRKERGVCGGGAVGTSRGERRLVGHSKDRSFAIQEVVLVVRVEIAHQHGVKISNSSELYIMMNRDLGEDR